MKYTLDTLPVLDAYKTGCECPLCRLRISCEDSYVDSMLGAAYMLSLIHIFRQAKRTIPFFSSGSIYPFFSL